ncbi:pentatricopeptide repeat-containing protein At4g21170 isoform X1 [Argentina anserina]|uniref:pentatricopeptide repeat-containing protein At4g21170 isoform X1 n=1 Tax=Argentina anserina TaxID=57926 RepID=UPI0021767220|nr:pentatricopeptide repeat-containing protein At4g21170 isoform X1 [Potentilla anserina]
MLPLLLHKAYSTTSSTSLTWRTQLKQAHLASQISSILLQRRNWVPLLQNLNLPKLNPPLFLQILHKTQQNPQLSLDFFNWAKFHLRFEPDLKSHCQIIQLSLGSGLTRPVKPILDTLIQTHHVSKVVQSMVQVTGTDSLSNVLSFVLGCYAKKGLVKECLEVYREMSVLGCVPTVLACNALLNTMRLENETRLGWGFYGAMIRNGIISNQFTWSLVAQFLCKDGKFERIVKLLDSGVCDSMFYSLLVDGYSKSGNFEAAFCYLDKMSVGKLDPGFSTYSSVLDGACKHGNVEVVERVMRIMLEKKLLSKSPVTDYNSIVKKLCDLNKIYAAEMFFKKACEEKIELQIATYGCMLQSLTTEMRIVEAIWVYRLICERGIVVDDNSYNAFANVLCKKVQFEEGFELLMDVIRRGFSPCASELSGFISFLCGRRRWREAEDVLNSVLDKGLLPDLTSCSSLVRHYCSTRRINSATALHSKMEKLNGSLDATTYNVLLGGLFAARRVEEAVRVFDYMRSRNLMSSESFTIMIRGLCQVKELRKAMKIHDEMLKLGLKPPVATYRRLIHGFRP